MADCKVKTRASPARKPKPARKGQDARTQGTRNSVALLLRQSSVQTKLQVGAANDPAEKEADAIADRVLAGGLGVTATREAQAAPLRRSPMDQPNTDALNSAPGVPAEAAEFDLPKDEDVEMDALDATALTEVETGAPDGDEGDPAAAPLRRVISPVVGPEGGDAPAHIANAIENPAPGRPLPRAVRADLEPRFGASFGDVRLHDRPIDRQTAEAIGARAFAYKSDIWLGPGERAEDRKLMAHELTHVLQQTGRERSPLTQKGQAKPKRLINRFLGDAILEKIEGYARHIPGYTLISLILGKTPIAQKTVQRTPENFIYAVMGLHPLGTMLADRLKESRALPEAYEWITGQLSKLNLTWTRIKGVIEKAKELFSVLSPLNSIKPAFVPILKDLMTFVLSVKDKVLEFVLKGALKLAGPLAEKVWGVLQSAGQTLTTILEDPLAFAKNLFMSVAKGFGLFFSNFLKHLKKGLLGFIFGALDGVDITLPDRLDLKGIVSIVFQVLRLTWQHIRKLLVKRLGANGERKVALLEKGVDIIRLLISNGVLAIWQKMLAMIDNLASTVVGGVIEFLTVTLVKGALGWLAGLSNPVGAVIKIALMIYDFVVMLLERMQQIMDFVSSVFSSIAEIARGNIGKAAAKVEESIGRTVPLILAFLAALIPITGIASKIQKIMKKLRKPVDKALNKLVKFLVKKAKKVLSKIVGKINGKRKLPATTFKVGKKTHDLYAKKKGKGVEIYVKSNENPTDTQTDRLKKQQGEFKRNGTSEEDLKHLQEFIALFETTTNKVEKEGDDVKPDSKTKSQESEVKQLQKAQDDAKVALDKSGAKLAGKPNIDFNDPDTIIRYKVAVSEFEGQTGLYNDLAARKKNFPADAGRVLQLDHNPNRSSLEVVQTWLAGAAGNKTRKTVLHFREPKGGKVSEADMIKTSFGQLSVRSAAAPGGKLPAMAIYGKYNNAMAAKDADRASKMKVFLNRKGLSDLTAIKTKLREQLVEKTGEITKLYGNEPEPLKKNIEIGGKQLLKLAETDLKLSAAAGASDSDRQSVENIARTLDITGKSSGTNFLENEGATGKYSDLSGKKTLVSFLEADHNPMDSEMAMINEWTLGGMGGRDKEAELVASPEIEALNAKKKAAAKAAIKGALSAKVNGGKAYSKSVGGATVVAYGVNQHSSMKAKDGDLATKTASAAAPAFNETLKKALIADAVAGKSADDLAKPVRSAVNAKIRAAFRDRIVARQQMQFNLYATEEAPKIKAANADTGQGDKAVGLMGQIAATIKSSKTTSILSERANTFFPGCL